jgi:hypothetical protein
MWSTPPRRARGGGSNILCCHAPRRRGTQYAAASRLQHNRLWNTGSPAFAGDDSSEGGDSSPNRIQFSDSSGTHLRNLATDLARALRKIVSLEIVGGSRECRAHDAPAASWAETGRRPTSVVTTGHRNIRHSLRDGGTAAPCCPRGTGLASPRRLATSLFARLVPSVGGTGPHGLTVRFSRARHAQNKRPPHPVPRSWRS